jgi:4-hydroxythreonine-4-phosphate dehydrogenase
MSATDGSGSQLPLAVSMGDPAGIGPEIILKAWLARADAPGVPPFVAFADPSVLIATARQLGYDTPIRELSDSRMAAAVFPTALPVIPVGMNTPAVPGMPDPRNASAVIAAIREATAATASGRAAALVTAPIAKHVLYQAEFAHPGHTEYLAELARDFCSGGPFLPVMMLAGADLRVVPLTIHVALARVPAMIDAQLIKRTVRIVDASLRRDFAITRPRIAVAGLNPHAGEAGAIGTEERDVIAPAIACLAASGLLVTGPHSADTLFHAEARQRYDTAVCMFHDQALIPIKTIAFDTGVNVTLGLPFVRTSPDHGTAFDIAGRGMARPSSMIHALRMAAAIAGNRRLRADGPVD